MVSLRARRRPIQGSLDPVAHNPGHRPWGDRIQDVTDARVSDLHEFELLHPGMFDDVVRPAWWGMREAPVEQRALIPRPAPHRDGGRTRKNRRKPTQIGRSRWVR